MSPAQLDDELAAAGLTVLERGNLSPPSMESGIERCHMCQASFAGFFLCFFFFRDVFHSFPGFGIFQYISMNPNVISVCTSVVYKYMSADSDRRHGMVACAKPHCHWKKDRTSSSSPEIE